MAKKTESLAPATGPSSLGGGKGVHRSAVEVIDAHLVKTLEGADLVGSNGSIGFGFEKCRIARK
jgi:hypothetical protein